MDFDNIVELVEQFKIKQDPEVERQIVAAFTELGNAIWRWVERVWQGLKEIYQKCVDAYELIRSVRQAEAEERFFAPSKKCMWNFESRSASAAVKRAKFSMTNAIGQQRHWLVLSRSR